MNWNSFLGKAAVLALALVLVLMAAGMATPEQVSTIPNVGDTSNIGMWVTVMAVSLVALIVVGIVLIVIKRRKR